MCLLLSRNSKNKLFAIFLDFCSFSFFWSVPPPPPPECDTVTNYLNVSNLLMIYQPKNNNENLSLSGWYLAPILPGLTS